MRQRLVQDFLQTGDKPRHTRVHPGKYWFPNKSSRPISHFILQNIWQALHDSCEGTCNGIKFLLIKDFPSSALTTFSLSENYNLLLTKHFSWFLWQCWKCHLTTPGNKSLFHCSIIITQVFMPSKDKRNRPSTYDMQ